MHIPRGYVNERRRETWLVSMLSHQPWACQPALQAAGLNGQLLAAFCAACVDDGTATAGFHANAKTVGALAAGN